MHIEIDAVLIAVLERPAAERESFVDSVCGTDAASKARLRRLLRESDENDPFLSPGGAVEGAFGDDLADALARDEGVPLGDRIGPYRIVSELGRGGMAVVYLAERVDGAFGQQVALKVVKRGIDTDEVLTRFRQERQILASLNHPGIARLLDGGETPDGRPYLAMELVKGERIDRYCERAALGVDARVDLCIAVARAVQHAHRHLVVHRDLKPSNILITAEGEIRLLDFGIAKLLETSPVEYAAPRTRTALRVMTPEYASPEQVRGEPITTGSDVYQLGLILFELLTGRRAQVLDGRHPADVDAVVLHEPAPRPSTVAGTAHPARVRQLRGDLDNIVLTALNKEPERRYGSVEQFVDDLVRYRTGLPVAARGDSFRYRAGKFLGRHRHAAAAVAGVVVLVVGIVAFYSIRLASERDRARREAATATEVARFVGGLFQAADPIRSAGADVTARELLARGAARLDSELSDQPDVQVRLMSLIGGIYRSIGLLPEAISLQEKALASRRERLGPDHPEVGQSLGSLGMILYLTGRFDEARSRLEEALRIQEAALGPTHADLAETLNGLGLLHRRTGRSEEARDLFERALAVREQALGAEHQDVAPIANNLGLVYLDLDAYARSAEYFERSLSINERAFGPDSPMVAGNLSNLGDAFRQSGELEKARPLLERAVAGQEKAHGPDHRDVATALNSLALLLKDMKLYAEAVPLYERAQGIYERALGPGHAYVAYPIENLGNVYRAMGDYGRAQTQYERALEIRVGAFGDVHQNVAQTLELLGTLRVLMDDCRGAVPVLQRALDVTRETRAADHSWIGTSSLGLGSCSAQAGRHAEAEPLLLEAYRILREKRGPDDDDTMMAAKHLAAVYDAVGRPDDAARYRALTPPIDPISK